MPILWEEGVGDTWGLCRCSAAFGAVMSRYLAHGRVMMWQPALCRWTDAVPRRGLGCMRESHRRSARAAADCLVRNWDGDLSGSGGRKANGQPTVTTPWRALFDDDAREPSLSPLRLCLWIPRLWSPLVLLGACSPPCPVVLPPQSLVADSQQARKSAQRSGPSRLLGLFLEAQLRLQSMARRKIIIICTTATAGGARGRVASRAPCLVKAQGSRQGL